MSFSSRERVKKALSFQEPDRVPIDIGGTKITGIHVDEYIELGRYLGLDVELPKVYVQFNMQARCEEWFRQRCHSDVIEVENIAESWDLENYGWKPWTTSKGNVVLMPYNFELNYGEDGYAYINNNKGERVAFMSPGALWFERYGNTTMSENIIKTDPEEWKKSIPLYRDDHLRTMEKRAEFFHKYTQYSVHGGFLKGLLGNSGIFAGHTISDWLCLLLTDEDYAYSILQATAERAVENLKLYLQATGKYIDNLFLSSTDFGTQRSELFDPEIFARIYVPNYKLMTDYIHNSFPHIKIILHSCGSVFNLLEHFIDAGIDALNPIQTDAVNMDPVKIKEKTYGRLSLWGGAIDTQSMMQFGSTEEVREQVRERLKALAWGGGYVFATTAVQWGVPPENILAMADAAFEFGEYPIKL